MVSDSSACLLGSRQTDTRSTTAQHSKPLTWYSSGILLSLSIFAALGLAVYENPEVQRWVEEQRRKLAELLRSIGEELDPQSRRAAEAFAFEGRTPSADEIPQPGSNQAEAVAVATGRTTNESNTVRRVPIHGTVDPEQTEARRRLGEEYLQRRNEQMAELQQRRRHAVREEQGPIPESPTSFDAMVDENGQLREMEPRPDLNATLQLPPAHDTAHGDDKSVSTAQDTLGSRASDGLILQSSSSSAAPLSHDPFSDENQMDTCDTPKPPVPPKIELSESELTPLDMHQSSTPLLEGFPQPSALASRAELLSQPNDLSYEEQLAIALSLSEQESSGPSATVRRHSQEVHDAQLRAAIEASLRDMDHQQAAHAINHNIIHPEMTTSRRLIYPSLLDTPNENNTTSPPLQPEPLSYAPSGLVVRGTVASPSNESRTSHSTEDLYNVTPNLTRASLATLNAQQASIALSTSLEHHDDTETPARLPAEASFYSAHDGTSVASSTATLEREETTHHPSEDRRAPSPSGAHTPTTASSFVFSADSDSESSETFASVSALPSIAVPRSEISHAAPASSRTISEASVEMIDAMDDSDDDVMSVDGIATPDSWSEIGSRDGESEDERQRLAV